MDQEPIITDYGMPVAFYFKVIFGDSGALSFMEVSGLSAELEVETIACGGQNDYVLTLPRQVKHPNLVLKRALSPLGGDVEGWIRQSMESDFSQPITKVNVTINLLKSDGDPIMSWSCGDAFPVKWEVGVLDAQKNELVIETIELSYRKLTRLK